MNQDQLAKMQAGRIAAAAAKKAEAARLAGDEHAQWERLHKQAAEDLRKHRQAESDVVQSSYLIKELT